MIRMVCEVKTNSTFYKLGKFFFIEEVFLLRYVKFVVN